MNPGPSRRRQGLPQRLWRARRGNVALIFAATLTVIVISLCAAIDMSRLAVGRANLQVAADNAALSGAAAYALNGNSYKTLGMTVATTTFCNATQTLPQGFSVISSGTPVTNTATDGTTTSATAETCGTNPGPSVSAFTSTYTPGTVGTVSNAACTTLIPGNVTYTCAFIITVTATATMPSIVPALFGQSRTISVTAAAANPFINFAKVFSGTSIASGAKYANSVWVYALALSPTTGKPDYTTNSGALPDSSTCYAGPDQTICGSAGGVTNYVMLANTEYANKYICNGDCTSSSPVFTANNGVQYRGGVLQNPPTPPGITSTAPLGVAFESIAGGNFYWNQATPIPTPGIYGYAGGPPGGSFVYLPISKTGCVFPNDNLLYATVSQAYKTVTTVTNGVSTKSYTPLEPWTLTTHWFYSSYLSNPTAQAPSQGMINAQVLNNQTINSVPTDSANYGNVGGNQTYNTSYNSPSNCPSSETINTTSTYPATGKTNCSLVIIDNTANPNPVNYDGSCYTPAGTPGASYAALSCQNYGNDYYSFYWNDMGGAQNGAGQLFDSYNYQPSANSYVTQDGYTASAPQNSDGTVVLHCAAGTHVVLIQ